MGYIGLFLAFLVFGCANAQLYKVCVPSSESGRCQNLGKDGSEVQCLSVNTRIECATQLARGSADVGMFSDEEVLLLAQQQPDNYRVIASVRDTDRVEPYSFEAVAVVPMNHSNGFEGLRGGRYCHPGLGASDMRWSPRVLRALETRAVRTDRCEGDTGSKTAEELEVEKLSEFFSAACRPGPWSMNKTVDADLKSRFPNLCSMCTAPGTCAGYTSDVAVNVAGVLNSNRHIQALDCLRTNGTVAYVAWQHVREFFMTRNPMDAENFALLCEDETMVKLTLDVLNTPTSPCALVRQPWSTIVASVSSAEPLGRRLRELWPSGRDPGGNSWPTSLFAALTFGAGALVVFETAQTPLNYTAAIRTIASIDSTTNCLPPLRWCTLSAQEQDKCSWTRASAYSLGVQPTVSCQQRSSVFECLADIRDQRADFFSVDSHYGYVARQHFSLSPVKLVQNSFGASSRITALVKEASATAGNITRFENLRDKVACFPEFGGLAYMSFVRKAQEIGVISDKQCDYSRAVGEFFGGACAPGALDNQHSISAGTDFNATVLCNACLPRVSMVNITSPNDFTCSWDNSNLYYGNNGSLLCLADPRTDVAFVETQSINSQLQALGLVATNFRALCANNTLAAMAGVNVDSGCLLSDVVDAEILARRNDPSYNSINTLLDSLEELFGYNVGAAEQLINLHLYSPFDGTSDLLFKDTTIGLTEPSLGSSHAPARNYIDLFQHLETCNSAPPTQGSASVVRSVITLAITALFTRFVIY